MLKHTIIFLLSFFCLSLNAQTMMFADTTRKGVPFSKDPHVIKFQGRYLIYYSIPPHTDASNPVKGWGIGIAESHDLMSWKRIGEIIPEGEYEKKGLCAPCAIIKDGKVNLFYQTYGNGTASILQETKLILSSDLMVPGIAAGRLMQRWCSSRADTFCIMQLATQLIRYR